MNTKKLWKILDHLTENVSSSFRSLLTEVGSKFLHLLSEIDFQSEHLLQKLTVWTMLLPEVDSIWTSFTRCYDSIWTSLLPRLTPIWTSFAKVDSIWTSFAPKLTQYEHLCRSWLWYEHQMPGIDSTFYINCPNLNQVYHLLEQINLNIICRSWLNPEHHESSFYLVQYSVAEVCLMFENFMNIMGCFVFLHDFLERDAPWRDRGASLKRNTTVPWRLLRSLSWVHGTPLPGGTTHLSYKFAIVKALCET